MVEEGRGAPHGVLLAVVVGLVVAGPILLGNGDAITEAITGLISPAGLLFLPVVLLLLIQFLSSDRAVALSDVLFTGERDSIHRLGGSPFGVALLLLLLLFLLNNRISIFGSGDDDSGD